MVTRTFADLVRDLRLRRTVGDKPPVLLLGAGASVDAGIGAMDDLFAFFGLADFEAFSAYIAPTTAAERYRYLSDFLQTRKPAEVTPGYQALATLCAQNYFDLVLSTNMDPLLDDALAAAQLWRKDYLLIVNGVIRPDRLELLLGGQSPRVKIVKLHGDLFQRFMAWTVSEMDTFLSEIAPALKAAVAGRDVLVVGHSLRDERIRELAQSTGGALWFTHPQKVPDHLSKNDAMRAVIAPEAAFEKIFPALAQQLKAPPVAARHVRRGVSVNELVLDAVTTPTEHAIDSPNSPRGQTLDDALASVMSVMGPDGVPNSTAFLLSEPRVIVCDAFAVKALLGTRQELDLVGADHKPFTARMLRSNRGHPFGPTLLQVPDTVKIPGLRLTTEPVQLGEPVQIVVAAGKKTGLSTGAVTTAIEATIEIAPIGIVRDLSGLNAVVRSGASGAPVVDSAMRVIGFIVAGSEDEANPTSFMYPSQRWAKFLSNVNPRSLATSRRKPRGR